MNIPPVYAYATSASLIPLLLFLLFVLPTCGAAATALEIQRREESVFSGERKYRCLFRISK